MQNQIRHLIDFGYVLLGITIMLGIGYLFPAFLLLGVAIMLVALAFGLLYAAIMAPLWWQSKIDPANPSSDKESTSH